MGGIRGFGRLDDGRAVNAHAIGDPAQLSAEILDLGGILARLRVRGADGPVDVVLGLGDARAYGGDPAFLGQLIGRYGNRIAGATFELAGRRHALDANEGRNHLHGGAHGFGHRPWRVEAHSGEALVLSLRSPAGEGGYPGALDVRATYRVEGDVLSLVFAARCDAATPFNPTHHPYFNLAGDRTVPAAAQWLQVPASHYLPVDGELIPFGEVAPVAGTPFDFRIARGLAIAAPHPQLEAGGGLDHCLVLDPGRGFTAALYSPHSGLAMRIDSDAPGLQLYGGQGLARQHPGLGDGICLEPQDYPDAPNRPAFPPAILAPGRDYRRNIRYRFARPGRDRGWDEVAHALRLDRPGLGSPSGVPA